MIPARIFLTIGGETMTIREAAMKFGLSTHCISMRIKRGYSHEEAVGLPPAKPFERVDGEKRLSRLRAAKAGTKTDRRILSEDEREARAMIAWGRRDIEIAEHLGWLDAAGRWDIARVAALRTQGRVG